MADLARAILQLIQRENPKAPLTDEQIAQHLGVSRFQVTVARSAAGIPDSRERLRPSLMEAIRQVTQADPSISDRELTARLNAEGFKVSRFTVGHLRKEVEARQQLPDPAAAQTTRQFGPPVGAGSRQGLSAPSPEGRLRQRQAVSVAARGRSGAGNPFAQIIGSQGSLKPHIQQAKAAMLYPPNGLHTLIVGPSGVGKNQLAEAMYQFAVSLRGESGPIPFVAFNCADYAENPQLLLSQLFGHVRGAFTGAETAKAGLVEMADGGILFLDEVHRLPAEGQEILFQLMDRGRYRRLGETELERRATVTIIAATTESPESALLMTFRRRIPMIIELPALAERPFSERMELIRHFFRMEAARTHTRIRLRSEAARAFLLYDCPGNIGQLKSDIQVACARGFLVHVTEETDEVVVGLPELPSTVRRGLLKLPQHRAEVERLVAGDLIIQPTAEVQVREEEDLYTLPGEIYQYIENRHAALRKAGLTDSEISRLLDAELDRQIRQHVRQIELQAHPLSRDELVEHAGPEMVETVEAMLARIQRDLPAPDRHLYYCLVMHVSAAVERLRQGKPIVYPHLEDVRTQYGREFGLALEMLEVLRGRTGLDFPEDEAAFLAMYLRSALRGQEPGREGRVGLVVLTHGRVAGALVEVAGRLVGAHHARWFEMELDESPESTLSRLIPLVREADEGKGVLLLADMGSLLSFGEVITERTGIPTRTVPRVDILMVLEAMRRTASPDTSLDQVAEQLTSLVGGTAPRRATGGHGVKTIVTLCLTGQGTAERLKALLEKLLGGEGVEVVSLGVAGDVDIAERLRQLSLQRRLVAVVGTVDPGFPGIPFIPVEEVLSGRGAERVRRALGADRTPDAADLIQPEFLIPRARWSTREEALDACTHLLLTRGCVTQAFVTDVFRRELAGPTVLQGGVALPHGSPMHVQKPAVVVATLADPVNWAGHPVSVVCMLALGAMGKETFMQLYRVLTSDALVARIRAAASREEMRQALLEALQAPDPSGVQTRRNR